jgi:pimeloyl-ACP methyl ester carboxylesterase
MHDLSHEAAHRLVPERSGSATFLRRGFALLIASIAILGFGASCGGEGEDAAESERSTSAWTARLVDVGSHKLSLSCKGTGSPTVVYLHGLGGTSANGFPIVEAFTAPGRFCAYDRANLGASDTTTGRHTGADSVRDLHALLEAAGVPSPYVLVGASFGGLLSIMYAGMFPDDVAGLVLLDAVLPTDAESDRLIPKAERRTVIADVEGNPERVAFYESLRQSKPLVGTIPDIPVTYVAASNLELPPNWPVRRMTALIRKLQRAFIARFRQGRFVIVTSPHYMEPVVPERIVKEIERVLDYAKTR